MSCIVCFNLKVIIHLKNRYMYYILTLFGLESGGGGGGRESCAQADFNFQELLDI